MFQTTNQAYIYILYIYIDGRKSPKKKARTVAWKIFSLLHSSYQMSNDLSTSLATTMTLVLDG